MPSMAMSFPGTVIFRVTADLSAAEGQSNRTDSALQCRACYDSNSNMRQTSVRENLLRIQERIAGAVARAGRSTEEITLIGVSKTHPASAIREAYEAGIRHFGENRVQEWEGKRAGTEGLAATWHLIGHLQSNKTARAARLFHSVDSVDEFAIAQRLDRARAEAGITGKLRVLIEVHIAPEEAKSGVETSELVALAERVADLTRLELAGLMCIPPFLEK